MREAIRHPDAGLAVLGEIELRAEHFRDALDEGEALAFEVFLGAFLAVVFLEDRLVVEQLKLARRADHVEVDDALRLRREGGRLRGKRAGRIVGNLHRARRACESMGGQPHAAEAGGAVAQELAARGVLELLGLECLEEVHGKTGVLLFHRRGAEVAKGRGGRSKLEFKV